MQSIFIARLRTNFIIALTLIPENSPHCKRSRMENHIFIQAPGCRLWHCSRSMICLIGRIGIKVVDFLLRGGSWKKQFGERIPSMLPAVILWIFPGFFTKVLIRLPIKQPLKFRCLFRLNQ